MGELEKCDLDLNMFNSIKANTKEETAVLEKAPLLLDTKEPKDWYVIVHAWCCLVQYSDLQKHSLNVEIYCPTLIC